MLGSMQLLLARLRTVEEQASSQLLPLGIQLQLEQQGHPQRSLLIVAHLMVLSLAVLKIVCFDGYLVGLCLQVHALSDHARGP